MVIPAQGDLCTTVIPAKSLPPRSRGREPIPGGRQLRISLPVLCKKLRVAALAGGVPGPESCILFPMPAYPHIEHYYEAKQ